MADGDDSDAGSWEMETHQIKGSLRPRRGSEIIEPSPRSVAASTHQSFKLWLIAHGRAHLRTESLTLSFC